MAGKGILKKHMKAITIIAIALIVIVSHFFMIMRSDSFQRSCADCHRRREYLFHTGQSYSPPSPDLNQHRMYFDFHSRPMHETVLEFMSLSPWMCEHCVYEILQEIRSGTF